MPIISDIIPQKNKKFYSIFIDGEFKFSLSESDLKYLNLNVNDTISNEKLNFFIDTYVKQRAFDYAYKLLSKKMVSETFLYDKLKDKNFPLSIIEEVINKLKEINYINDEKFIEEYAYEKVNYKKIGPFRLYAELKNKKFKEKLIKKTIDKIFSKVDEVKIAKESLNKKFKNIDKEIDIKTLKKIESFLRSRGFTSETIYQIIKEIQK